MNEPSETFGFIASRSEAEALKSKYPNTLNFFMLVKHNEKDFTIHIKTECGEGVKTLATLEQVKTEIATVRKTFEEEGGWTITDVPTKDNDETE